MLAIVSSSHLSSRDYYAGWLYGKLRDKFKIPLAIFSPLILFAVLMVRLNVGITVFVLSVVAQWRYVKSQALSERYVLGFVIELIMLGFVGGITIQVFHQELARAHNAGLGAEFVSELGLETGRHKSASLCSQKCKILAY